MIYFDHNATTEPLPSAREAVIDSMLEGWGNPSSGHGCGQRAKSVLVAARDAVARTSGQVEGRVIFTSGATEAINHAVCDAGPGRIIISAVEHPAVAAALSIRPDRDVTLLPVDSDGRVSVEQVLNQIDDGVKPALVSVMAANNETGVIQPVAELAEALKSRAVPFMVDAVQFVGRSAFSCHPDYLIVTGHKLGGIKGAGALIVEKGRDVKSLIAGGGQEWGQRGGTEAMPAIAAFGAAMAHLEKNRVAEAFEVARLRDRFEVRLKETITGVTVVGEKVPRICSTSLVLFPEGVEGEAMVNVLAAQGVAVSAGSACKSGSLKPSRVLTAMGVKASRTFCALRFSFGVSNTEDEVERVIAMLPGLVKKVAG